MSDEAESADSNEEPDNYIDPTVGDDGYVEIRVSVFDDDLEHLGHGFTTTREFETDDGEIIAVNIDPKRDADKEWLLQEIGAEERPTPRLRLTVAALAVFGASLSVAAMVAPSWMMIPAATPMMAAGLWIIEEVRRGYDSEAASEEATA